MTFMSFVKEVGLGRISLSVLLFALATQLGAQQSTNLSKKPVAPAAVAKPSNKANMPPVGYVPPGVVMPPPEEVTAPARSVGSMSAAEANAASSGAAAADPASPTSDKPSAMTTEVMPAPQTFGGKQTKLALVIGNAAYKEAPLLNPANDAQAMAIKLQELGFTVIKKENAGREDMLKAVRDFGNQLKAKADSVGLFYYAGHGIQSKGNNYLVPVDADIASEDELASRAYNVNEVLEKMDSAKNPINIVILDACRNNPFGRSFRSTAKGLAQVEAVQGTYIAYATAPGKTASDGSGRNGLYTESLLKALSQPGLKLEEVFKKVAYEVSERSGKEQTPWGLSSLLGDFYFNPTKDQIELSAASPSAPGAGMGDNGGAREFLPVLMPRRLLQTHQFLANIPQVSPSTFGHFSNNGKLLALASQDKILRIVDVGQGAVAQAIPNFGHATVSPDGRYVLGLTDSGDVNVVDLDQEAPKLAVRKIGTNIAQATIAPGSARVLVYGNKGYRLLNLDTGLLAVELGDVDGAPHFAFSPTGHRLITWGANGSNLKLWDTAKGERITSLSSHWKPVSFAKFSPDGNLLFTASFDDRMVVWRTSDGEDLRRLTMPDKQPVPSDAEFLSDGKGLLLTFKPGRLGVWDIASGREETTADLRFSAKRILFSKDRQKMFVGSTDGNVRVIDVASRSVVSLLSSMQLLALSDDGKRLITMDGEGIRLMDAGTFAPIARLPGQTDAFISTKKRNLLVTTSNDGKLTLWNMEKAEQLTQLKGHLDAVAHVYLAGDAQHILSVGNDRTLKLWGLPQVQDMANLVKDPFESTTEYMGRAKGWGSDFSMLVALGDYNADSELYSVKIGDASVSVPLKRDEARKLAGQRQAVLTTKLKFFDVEQLQLVNSKLERLP